MDSSSPSNKVTADDFRDSYESIVQPSESIIDYLYKTINDVSHRGAGKGGYYNRTQQMMSRTDRYGQNPMATNSECVGLTFITKPKLNLTTTCLRHCGGLMATLDSMDPRNLSFAIRCYLDSNFSTIGAGRNLAKLCAWFDSDTAYINPLSNALTQIHGWPSFDLAVSASEDGFYSEHQTIARGSDFLNQTYDLSLTFTDIQGGPILMMLYYWVYWIALLCRGRAWRYMEDTLERRLSYTCSIYRFVYNTNKKTVTKWAKATGCFPKSIPMGENFDITSRTHFIDALQEFSVPFVANHIEYMEPDILKDFNYIMDKFGGPMYVSGGRTLRSDRIPLSNSPNTNFMGIPYFDLFSGTNELMWLGNKDETANTPEAALAALKVAIDQEMVRISSSSDSSDTGNSSIVTE